MGERLVLGEGLHPAGHGLHGYEGAGHEREREDQQPHALAARGLPETMRMSTNSHVKVKAAKVQGATARSRLLRGAEVRKPMANPTAAVMANPMVARMVSATTRPVHDYSSRSTWSSGSRR
jgi:hypothetical protein